MIYLMTRLNLMKITMMTTMMMMTMKVMMMTAMMKKTSKICKTFVPFLFMLRWYEEKFEDTKGLIRCK